MVATDAGREGCLIFRYIYDYLNCNKPFDRLWISSLTDKHGFSADKTLSIAQKLYEAKLITYPRTGSRYISEDVFDEIPQLIDSLKAHPHFGNHAQKIDVAALNRRCVDDKKITDHHALLITENLANDLSGDEQTVYEMIAGRMLETFSKKCIKDATTIVCSCADTTFEAKGLVIKQTGWRGVFAEAEETDESETANLPDVHEGETLPVIKSKLLEKQIKAKPLHTEASLLSAMENCGRDIADEAEREAIKDCGIGTPATRAAIIETLFSRDYIRREKKSLHDTLVNILWNEFADEVSEDEVGDLAVKLLPECEPVFAGYPLSDGFAYKPEYELLYTELTGTIALYLESHSS